MIGSRFGTIAVLKLNQLKKYRSRSGTTGAETAGTQVSKKFGQFLPIFAKNYKFFQKFYLIFTHFSNENLKSFYLQRPQPHPSARENHAGVRQKSGWLERRATSWRRPNASCRLAPASSDDAGIRARDPEGTQDSRVRRGRARSTPAASASADAPVRVSELLRSPQRAKHFVKNADGLRQSRNLKMFQMQHRRRARTCFRMKFASVELQESRERELEIGVDRGIRAMPRSTFSQNAPWRPAPR